ncbi:MAG: hypothetical protein NTZ33_14540 [Bacteroidetes bacterium]|nr:hypothetical protein [Bacteroidota bacterium]
MEKVLSSEQLLIDADLDANGKKIKNLAAAVNPDEAVNLGQMEEAIGGGSDAETEASIAAIITGASACQILGEDEMPFYKKVGGLLKKVTYANFMLYLNDAAGIFTNKRIIKRKMNLPFIDELIPEVDTYDEFILTGQERNLLVSNYVTSTPEEGDRMLIYIFAVGVYTVGWENKYVSYAGYSLPTATIANKRQILEFRYEANSHVWTLVKYDIQDLPFVRDAYYVHTDNNFTTILKNIYDALVSFPGFGTDHANAAYGDHTHSDIYEPANSNIQTHITGTTHAPSNAQKNSDITKAEIEAVLTGELTSHSHAPAGSLWTLLPGTPVRIGNTSFRVTGDVTSYVAKGLVLKWTESAVVKCAMVSIASTYSNPNTTITIVGDIMASIDASSLKYYLLEPTLARFAYAGTVGATGVDVMNMFPSDKPYRILGGQMQVRTVASTSGTTTVDINVGGTTVFTTKLTLAYNSLASVVFTADNGSSLAADNQVTIDIDGVTATTFPVDLYIQLYLFPTRLLNLS